MYKSLLDFFKHILDVTNARIRRLNDSRSTFDVEDNYINFVASVLLNPNVDSKELLDYVSYLEESNLINFSILTDIEDIKRYAALSEVWFDFLKKYNIAPDEELMAILVKLGQSKDEAIRKYIREHKDNESEPWYNPNITFEDAEKYILKRLDEYVNSEYSLLECGFYIPWNNPYIKY